MGLGSDFLFRIRSIFDGGGTQEAVQAIEEVETATTGAAGATTEGAAASHEAASAHEEVAESAKHAGEESSFLGEGVEEVTGKFFKAIAAAALIEQALEKLKETYTAFAGKQDAVAGLDAALAARGQLTDEYREKLQELAAEQQEVTGKGDEEWEQVFQTLTQFGATADNMDRYTEAVKNLAGLLGGDLSQAAFLFGKAMQGQTESLGRYGIIVDKTKSQAEQLDELMGQLAVKGGGVLEARTHTLTGGFTSLSNATEDTLAIFGHLFERTGILQEAVGKLVEGLKEFDKWTETPIEKVEGLANKISLQGRAADETSAANDAYAASLKTIEDGAAAAERALDAEIRKLEDQARGERDIALARRDLALAKNDADTGISEEERAKKKAQIESAYRETELSLDGEAMQKQAAARVKAAELAEQVAAKAAADAKKKAQDAARADAHVAAEQAKIDAINAATKQAADAEAAFTNAHRSAMARVATLVASGGFTASNTAFLIRPDTAKLEAAAKVAKQKAEELLKAGYDPDAKKKADEADSAAKAARAEADALAKAAASALQRSNEENQAATEKVAREKELHSITKQTAEVQATAAVSAAKARDTAKEEAAARKESAGHAKAGANEAERAAKAAKEEAAAREAAWKAGTRPDHIDARSQVHRDAEGNIIEQHGQLAPGATKDKLGFITGPSSLPPKTSAAPTPDHAAPALHAAAESTQKGGQETAAAATALKTSADGLTKGSADLAGAASAFAAAVRTFQTTAADLKAKIEAIGRGT